MQFSSGKAKKQFAKQDASTVLGGLCGGATEGSLGQEIASQLASWEGQPVHVSCNLVISDQDERYGEYLHHILKILRYIIIK